MLAVDVWLFMAWLEGVIQASKSEKAGVFTPSGLRKDPNTHPFFTQITPKCDDNCMPSG
jgi:hypothetical protein